MGAASSSKAPPARGPASVSPCPWKEKGWTIRRSPNSDTGSGFPSAAVRPELGQEGASGKAESPSQTPRPNPPPVSTIVLLGHLRETLSVESEAGRDLRASTSRNPPRYSGPDGRQGGVTRPRVF